MCLSGDCWGYLPTLKAIAASLEVIAASLVAYVLLYWIRGGK